MVSKMEIYNDLKVICPSKKQRIVRSKTELHIEIQHAEFILVPLLFLPYIEALRQVSMIIKSIMFADDTNLFCYNETS